MPLPSPATCWALSFVVFGSNMFIHFIPNPPMPPGPLTDFTSALTASHYILAIGFFQVAPAILLLINRYVPLALTVLAGMIINIDLTHITMAPIRSPHGRRGQPSLAPCVSSGEGQTSPGSLSRSTALTAQLGIHTIEKQ